MNVSPDKRRRLRSWMENKVNSGLIPGLSWVNRQDGYGTFRIPWYHYNDVPDEEKPVKFKVFVEWANFTGKYIKGDTPNYCDYKTNLRCALMKMKKDFEKIVDNSHDASDPHVVYRFVSPSVLNQAHDSPFPGQDEIQNNLNISTAASPAENIPETVHSLAAMQMDNEEHNVHEVYNQMENQFQFSPQENNNYLQFGTTNGLPEIFEPLMSSPEWNIVAPQVTVPTVVGENQACSQFDNAHYPSGNAETSMEAKFPSDLVAVDLGDLIPKQEPCSIPMNGLRSLSTPDCSLSLGPVGPCNGATASASGAHSVKDRKHKMALKVCYSQQQVVVMEETVGEDGCRLYFGERILNNTMVDEEMYGPKNVKQVMLPIAEMCTGEVSDRQRNYISSILDEMSRGLILTFNNGDIYAQRLSKSRVYYCDAHFHSITLDRKSNSPQKVFDFHNFKSAYSAWLAGGPGRRSHSPPAHFYLTIGSEVDPTNRRGPLSSVLISVSVTHHLAAEMLQQAHAAIKETDGSLGPHDESMPDVMDHLLKNLSSVTL